MSWRLSAQLQRMCGVLFGNMINNMFFSFTQFSYTKLCVLVFCR